MVFPPSGIAKRAVESERWACFLPRSARSDLLVVRMRSVGVRSTPRREKRGQREAIGEKHRLLEAEVAAGGAAAS